jgi:hypothetical protein
VGDRTRRCTRQTTPHLFTFPAPLSRGCRLAYATYECTNTCQDQIVFRTRAPCCSPLTFGPLTFVHTPPPFSCSFTSSIKTRTRRHRADPPSHPTIALPLIPTRQPNDSHIDSFRNMLMETNDQDALKQPRATSATLDSSTVAHGSGQGEAAQQEGSAANPAGSTHPMRNLPGTKEEVKRAKHMLATQWSRRDHAQ